MKIAAALVLFALASLAAVRLLPADRRRLPWRNRRRRPHRAAEDSLLPPRPPGLFTPSHHETLHDPGYLRRMLEAEQARKPREGSGARTEDEPVSDEESQA